MKIRVSKDQIIFGVLDCAISVLALWLAISVKNEELFIFRENSLAITFASLLIIPIGVMFGVYRPIGYHLTRNYVKLLSLTFLVYGLFFASVCLFSYPLGIPRSVGIIQPLFAYGLTLLVRVLYEKIYSSLASESQSNEKNFVAIYGAGESGQLLYRAIFKTKFNVIGFIDDKKELKGRTLFGCKIYSYEDLSLLKEKGVSEIYIAIPSLSGTRRRELFQQITKNKIKVKTVPSLAELTLGGANIKALRDLQVDDLLGRSSVKPNYELMRSDITGRVVMVTGAGGSIGSELCRQILFLNPNKIILLEHNEFSLFTIEQELIQKKQLNKNDSVITALLGNAGNQEMMDKVIKSFGVETIFHAAAYKHVDLVEKNPGEGLKNNILGTLSLVRAAMNSPQLKSFVLISTDKAVRPKNVMGLSKRISELVIQCYAIESEKRGLGKRFCSVRFGNVLGSAGSVVPIFTNQIKNGGPLTVTSKDATRYFMTIPEAASLVIQAGAMSRGGDTFILDMGLPIKIIDLALRMVELSGLNVTFGNPVDGEIQIKFTGLKQGEKIHEELGIDSNFMKTAHPKINKINEPIILAEKLLPICERLNSSLLKDGAVDIVGDFYDLISSEIKVAQQVQK
jgi:FlaA1/EpsC-like NDP-sugar epimerase